jgi:hypothetical protein
LGGLGCACSSGGIGMSLCAARQWLRSVKSVTQAWERGLV